MLRRVPPAWKGYAVDLDYKASKDLAKMAVWSEKSLRHAREHGQRKLVWLLRAVKADVEFEGALHALLPGEHLGSARGGYWGELTHNNYRKPDTADDVRKREQDQEKARARVVAWELFMETERRDLRLRQRSMERILAASSTRLFISLLSIFLSLRANPMFSRTFMCG